MGYFTNKVFILTGAGSGIGLATAKLLAKDGARVGLLDVAPLNEIQAEISAAGGKTIAIYCDVSSSVEVESAIQQVVDQFGPLDGAANLAGVIGSGKPSIDGACSLLTLSDEEWNRIFDINVGGVKNCLRAEMRHYNPKGCSIVNAASVSARIGSPWNAAYSASKAAIVGLTKSIAQEMGVKGVRVNAISPGVTKTPMVGSLPLATQKAWAASNALKRLAEPEEIADMVLYLLSDKSSFMTAAASVDRALQFTEQLLTT